MSVPELHSSIVALVSLASGIAAKHPDMGLCQLEKLRGMGIPDEQIGMVIEIARHIRDEAAEKLDTAFDEKAGVSVPEVAEQPQQETNLLDNAVDSGSSCCSPTPSGQSCC